jgi:hypothetical protein
VAGDLGPIPGTASRGEGLTRAAQLLVDLSEAGRGHEIAVRADNPVRDVVCALVLVLVLDEGAAHRSFPGSFAKIAIEFP